jgi:hypothetical protein
LVTPRAEQLQVAVVVGAAALQGDHVVNVPIVLGAELPGAALATPVCRLEYP